MAEFPALPLWTDAYMADTTHLTTIEHGAYFLLLVAMWRSPDCDLPDDDKMLARYARLTAGQWARIRPVLMPFFRAKNGRITQGRLTDEREAVRQHSKRQSDKSKARWLKNKETTYPAAMPGACPSDASLNPSHTHTQEEEGSYEPLSSGDDARPLALAPSKPDPIPEALSAYNAAAAESGWPQVRHLTPARRSALAARLREAGGIAGWAAALAKAQASPWCCGQNARGWRANFDFLTRQSSFAKLMEGNYDERPVPPTPARPRQAAVDAELAARVAAQREWAIRAGDHGADDGLGAFGGDDGPAGLTGGADPSRRGPAVPLLSARRGR